MKTPKKINWIARDLGVRESELIPVGNYKAKIDPGILGRISSQKQDRAKYILISAMTPTPFGEGKTVTTIGLSMALNRLKRRSVSCLRQSSMGPLFGAKGSGSGGGESGVIPEDEINLHFTGDVHAVGVANNLIVSFLENTFFHGNHLGLDPASFQIRRCLDASDRSLRHIDYNLRRDKEKVAYKTGFDITAASEVMSILALSRDFEDMRRRLGDIVVAQREGSENDFIRVNDLQIQGMLAAVLRDAIKPNLVQTSEHTPCLIHAGPFANVSIGTSSVLADLIGLGLSDYVVTETGFGADCGAEKFFDIKCRYGGRVPDLCVLVCSLRAIKAQSGLFTIFPGEKIDSGLFAAHQEALEIGLVNLKKQIENIRIFGVSVVVCINVFPSDTAEELKIVSKRALEFGALDCCQSRAWASGSKGCLDLAQSVIKHARMPGPRERIHFLYSDQASLLDKIKAIATGIYGARDVDCPDSVRKTLEKFERQGFGRLPVCIAKTQFSLSHDESLKGAPTDFIFPLKEAKLAAGAGFVLAYSSTMQMMPGLPREPRGENIQVDDYGRVKGL